MDEAGFLKAAQLAMRLEGIPEESIEHIINRLVYGDPHGMSARRRVTENKVQIHLTAPAQLPEVTRRLQAMSAQALRRKLS